MALALDQRGFWASGMASLIGVSHPLWWNQPPPRNRQPVQMMVCAGNKQAQEWCKASSHKLQWSSLQVDTLDHAP